MLPHPPTTCPFWLPWRIWMVVWLVLSQEAFSAEQTAVNATNSPPRLSSIADQRTAEGTRTQAIEFVIADKETSPDDLRLDCTSSNPFLVPPTGVAFAGTGPHRTVAVTPEPGQSGSSTITVSLTDGSATARNSFVLEVTPSTLRILRVAGTNASPGTRITVPIELASQGDENALGFGVQFDPAALEFVGITRGSATREAQFIANPASAASGRVGVVMALPADQRFQAGLREVASLSFRVLAKRTGARSAVGFTDAPVSRQVVDARARALPASYQAGEIAVK